MGLVLCNGYTTTISTAIAFYNPDTCAEGPPFEMMGWWVLAPGSCALVFANDLEDRNRYWYYFAMANDGAVWSGPYGANVTTGAFGGGQWCYGSQHGGGGELIRIGYRELDIGSSDDYTLTFVP
jgi:uncharacterized membrane protein